LEEVELIEIGFFILLNLILRCSLRFYYKYFTRYFV